MATGDIENAIGATFLARLAVKEHMPRAAERLENATAALARCEARDALDIAAKLKLSGVQGAPDVLGHIDMRAERDWFAAQGNPLCRSIAADIDRLFPATER